MRALCPWRLVPLPNLHHLPSRASSQTQPKAWGTRKEPPDFSNSGCCPHPQLHHQSLPKGSTKARARFNTTHLPSPFSQFTSGEYKGKGVNVGLTKPENPAGSYLTAYISITLLLNICIGGKSRFAWRDLFKTVTELFFPLQFYINIPMEQQTCLWEKLSETTKTALLLRPAV